MRKGCIYLALLLIFLIGTKTEMFSQVTTVGNGSYTATFPGTDVAGRNAIPAGTPRVSGAAASKPIASSDWWTGLLTFDNSNLYNYPMSLRALANGLVVSYTTPGLGADDTRQPMSGDQPLLVGVSGLSATYPTVSDYSDWTVTTSWASGTHSLSAIIGMGMPFVYFTKASSDVASVTVTIGTATVQNEMILVTNSLGGANFAVYAPVGSTWTLSGNTYTSTLAGKNYFSVALLPAGFAAATAANDFKQYAYVFPSNPTVTWAYDNATATCRSTFTVTADKKEGTGSAVLLGLLPHQWAHLASSSPQPGNYYYTTVRGQMKMLASNSFVVENKFKGILPTLPNTAKYSSSFDPGALATKIDQVKGDGLQEWTDSYNDGLAMNRLIQVAKIADQNGNTAARDQIINTVKTRLEKWFKVDGSEVAFLFYYNSTWSTLIGYPAGYYSDANLNDHHFHYGYFVSAAAAVEQYNPGWAAQWGGMVNMIIKDAANWDKTDTKFPFLRNFNPYAGHSFACGLLNNEPHGNNQESSSEAMNFNASLINWGTITGNTAIRDLGIYLYTTEQTAIDEYYFNVNNRNFSATYAHPIASRVWGNGYDRGTFWTNDIAATYGIEMVPLTAASTYLGQNTTYVTKLWNEMKTKTGVLSNTPNDNLWYDVYWSYLAFIDPAQAISLYNAYPTHAIKNGESDANTYNWLHSFNGAGQLDGTITANYPIAVVYNKAGVKTYVAHNYGASAITVNYSDGYSMSVPARTMKTSKDIDAAASLIASATQIPVNGTVTLTATVTGTTTKVEFYNGTTLIGTKTAAPYSITTAALPAGKPNFYVKAYNGTSFNLSNVVKVLVGSQLAYGGVNWAIPGTIEAGNYDTFEGGIGQDVAYFDDNTFNEAGSFRSPEYVDAGATTGEGNTVGWINSGEWLEYTVNVASGGTYTLGIRYACGNTAGGGPFHIEVDGTTVASNITVALTSTDWNTWATKTITGVSIPSGTHVIRMAFDNGGFNMGKTTFTYTGGGVAVTGVSMSPTSASVAVGATTQLTATVAPSNATNKNVTWTTSNAAVATVSTTGLVTGIAAGSATITVTTQDASKTATSVITVTSTNIPVTGVSVSPTSASLAVNATQQLTATILPTNATNKSVNWTTSNSTIATVSTSGLVTAKAAGTATITVTTVDGSKTATSAITVTATPTQTPYSGTAISIPGTIEAENFDNGGQGIAYNDAETANQGSQYRTTEGVDIEICNEGGYNVGWTAAGEWMEYTINVPTAGTYNIDCRVASDGGGSLSISVNDIDKTGTMTVPNTTGWQVWQTISKTGVSLSAGTQVLKLVSNGGFNLNKITISSAGVPVTGVTIVPTSISIAKSATYQLSATVSPSNATNQSVTWSSSNTAVATVSSTGLVTAVAGGSANVTVTTVDGAKTDVCAVTVSVPVTGVNIVPTSVSVAKGATYQLSATISPSDATNKNVTWTSSNTAVATVSSAGLVTGVAVGTANVTVTSVDGAKTDVCAVTVTTSNVAVTGVTIVPTSISVASGATYQLSATVAPSNATNQSVTWSSSNTAIATVSSSGLVTGVAAGSANVTVTTADGAKTDICAVTVTSTKVNLALNKTVTTSTVEAAGYEGAKAVDGNTTTTRWSSVFADPQWIYVDLGTSYNVNEVKITWEAACASNFTVQISSDATNWTTMKTITGNTAVVNDYTGLTGTGRYVRIYGSTRATAYGYSIFELEVYGTTATNRAPIANAGADQTITATSVALAGSGSDPDGNAITYSWIQVSGPNTAVWSSKTVASPTLSSLVVGTYTMRLSVSDGSLSSTDDVVITVNSAPTTCSVTASTGDYKTTISTDASNPTLTFVPITSGAGSTVCILYYGTTVAATYPGYTVTPNTPYRITAPAGSTVYFYYTYSTSSGEKSTMNTKNSFTVGSCAATVKSAVVATEVVETENNIVEAFPVPMDNVLNLRISGNDYETAIITDLSGKLVKRRIILTNEDIQLDVSDLKKGVYFLNVVGAGKRVTKKLIK